MMGPTRKGSPSGAMASRALRAVMIIGLFWTTGCVSGAQVRASAEVIKSELNMNSHADRALEVLRERASPRT